MALELVLGVAGGSTAAAAVEEVAAGVAVEVAVEEVAVEAAAAEFQTRCKRRCSYCH